MLSFTPVSGKKKEREGKNVRKKQGSSCGTLHLAASVSNWLTLPGIIRKIQKLQVAKAEGPHIHRASPSSDTTAYQKGIGRGVDREGGKQEPWVTGVQLTHSFLLGPGQKHFFSIYETRRKPLNTCQFREEYANTLH